MTEHDSPTPDPDKADSPGSAPIPVSSVSRDDLARSHPELVERIAALTEDEVDYIAEQVSDALHEIYWLVVRTAVAEFFASDDE
jgi:hypothetical protein